MKTTLKSLLVLAVLAGCVNHATSAQAQGKKSQEVPHKIGLIDMSYVFKNYKKFQTLREDLKAEISQTDQKAKSMAQRLQSLKQQMKQLEEGSPDYIKREKEATKLSSDFQTFRKVAKKDFLRKESRIYKTIYMEVVDAVQKYADYYNLTLVLRFDRNGLDKVGKPPEVIQRLNQQVVYHRKSDDISEPVLDYLNRKYEAESNAGSTSNGGSQGGNSSGQ